MTRALAALVLFAALPSQALTNHSGPYELQVLIGGAPARTFRHDGDTFVLGYPGERYTLRVVNHSGRRGEAGVSVDGRDGVDRKPADGRGSGAGSARGAAPGFATRAQARRAARSWYRVRRSRLLSSDRGSFRARARAARGRDWRALRRSRRARRARHRGGWWRDQRSRATSRRRAVSDRRARLRRTAAGLATVTPARGNDATCR